MNIVCRCCYNILHQRLLPWNALKRVLRCDLWLIFELIKSWRLNLTGGVSTEDIVIVHGERLYRILLCICKVKAVVPLDHHAHLALVIVVLIYPVELRVGYLIDFHVSFVFCFDVDFGLVYFVDVIKVFLSFSQSWDRVFGPDFGLCSLIFIYWWVGGLRLLYSFIARFLKLLFWRFLVFNLWHRHYIGYRWSAGFWILWVLSWDGYVGIEPCNVGIWLRLSIRYFQRLSFDYDIIGVFIGRLVPLLFVCLIFVLLLLC